MLSSPQERVGPAGPSLRRKLKGRRDSGLARRPDHGCAVTHAFDVMCRQLRQITLRGTQVEKKDSEQDSRTLQKKWDRTKSRLRAELGEDIFKSWFARVKLEGIKDSTAHFSVPTPFLKKWLRSHYNDRLLDCCNAEFAEVKQIEFRVRRPHDSSETTIQQDAPGPSDGAETVTIRSTGLDAGMCGGDAATGYRDFEGSPLDRRLTFDGFVVGSSNRLVHAAATEIAESVGQSQMRYNPLFIHGSVGHGKTHLLNAIAWHARTRQPHAQVLYLTAEWFMSRFVQALKSKAAVAFIASDMAAN